MKNVPLFLISAAIAVLLFLFVHSQRNSIQRVLVLPVEVQNVPRDKVILLPTLRQIQVTVQGPAFIVAEAAASAHSVKVDLPAHVGDRFEVAFDERDLGLPPAIQVVRIEPASIQLILDRRVRRSVPVIVPRIGSFRESVKLISFKVEPTEVGISGPETEVKGITHIETAPLDLRDLEGAVSRKLPIVRSGWQYSESDVSEITVTIDLLPLARRRTFTQVPIEIRAWTPREVRLEPPRVNIEVSGLSDVIEALKTQDIVAYVKLEGGAAAADVGADLPEGVKLIHVEPARVTVLYPAPEHKESMETATPEEKAHGAEK